MTVPPFTGSIDFKLAIGAFDVRVLRKARLTYAYMPAWYYYDVRSGTECFGDFQLDIGLSILALPRSDRSPNLGHIREAVLGTARPAADDRHIERARSPPAPLSRGRRSA
jgi:hypothetical protein